MDEMWSLVTYNKRSVRYVTLSVNCVRKRTRQQQSSLRIADLPTSLEHCLFDRCNATCMLRNMSRVNYHSLKPAEETKWWLLMGWCPFGARTSARTMMAYAYRCISGLSQRDDFFIVVMNLLLLQ